MADAIQRTLEAAVADGTCCIGQIAFAKSDSGSFRLTHRDDKDRAGLQFFRNATDAVEIAKFDDAGNYRPLKTAPNLRHGWQLELPSLEALWRALEYFYPGRLAAWAAWQANELRTTPLRETLERQSGMYRVAAKISDEQINDLVGNFCRSDGGCLRTILWKRDASGALPSTNLPPTKFDPAYDQTSALRRPGSATPATSLPLLCQEVCNLLVAKCREVVKTESVAPSLPE